MHLSPLPQAQVLDDLRRHLQACGYSVPSTEHQCIAARQFLQCLEERCIPLAAVQPSHVVMYMRRRLQQYRRHHGRLPRDRSGWRAWCIGGIVQLLRLTHAQWPPPRPPRDAAQAHVQNLIREYRAWLHDCRGLAASTIAAALEETQRFLSGTTRISGRPCFLICRCIRYSSICRCAPPVCDARH
jgi:hypothetical protein